MIFLVESIVGKIKYEHEILYDDDIRLFDNESLKLIAIESCYIYEISYQSKQVNDRCELDVNFNIELEYSFQDCHKKVPTNSIWKKYSNKKSFIIEKSEFPEIIKENMCHILIVSAIQVPQFTHTILNRNGAIHLKLVATLEGYFTNSYHSNILECQKLLSEADQLAEPINWQSIVENLNISDILTLFESFFKLIRIFFGTSQQESPTDKTSNKKLVDNLEQNNERLLQANQILKAELQTAMDTKNGYQGVINERNEIIDKLLQLLDKKGDLFRWSVLRDTVYDQFLINSQFIDNILG